MNNHTYIVHENTCALLPAKQIEYGTMIIEHKETKKERAVPFDIIKESCTHYWSNYEGRRNAVIQKLGYKQKTPIPLSIQQKICFFPTHSPSHIDNCWINFDQIKRWDKTPKTKQLSREQIKVIFKNGTNITVDVSVHTFSTQFDRAFAVMYQSGMVSFRDI